MPRELFKTRVDATRKERRAKLIEKGLCGECGGKCQTEKVTCDDCCKKKAIRKRARNGFTYRRLTSKLSGERPQAIVRAIRATNEYLHENWSLVETWVTEHFELWAPSWDQTLYTATPLRGIDDDSKQQPSDDFILRGCYRDMNWTALEDLVIAKIDAEREMKNAQR